MKQKEAKCHISIQNHFLSQPLLSSYCCGNFLFKIERKELSTQLQLLTLHPFQFLNSNGMHMHVHTLIHGCLLGFLHNQSILIYKLKHCLPCAFLNNEEWDTACPHNTYAGSYRYASSLNDTICNLQEIRHYLSLENMALKVWSRDEI